MPSATGNRMRGPREAGLDDRWRRQIGDVEYRARPVIVGHRLAEHGVGEPGNDPHRGIGLPGQQSDLEVQRVIVVYADDRLGVGDPGLGQADRRLHRHDACPGDVQLLDDPHRQCIVAANDGVAAHALRTLLRKSAAVRGEDGHMRSNPRIYVKACINGARTPDQHPNLPVTPDQLAAEALAAHQAGAKAVHMHPEDRRWRGLTCAGGRRRRGVRRYAMRCRDCHWG